MRLPIPHVLALLAISGCQAPACPPAASADPGSFVRGRVVGADAADPAKAAGVEAAEVSLTDAAGQPLAYLARARTDASGEFVAPQLPAGHTYVMTARVPTATGGEAVLKTLARPGTDPNVFWDLSPASTIVTTRLTQGVPGLPGTVTAATYEKAIALVAAKLAGGAGAPNLADVRAVNDWLDARQAEDPVLAEAMSALIPQAAQGEPAEPVEAQAAATADVDPLDALRPIY